jgi:aspartyl-tRNA(Asn)/glutamyl-tRNA(Gln) amidotransferase subunit A
MAGRLSIYPGRPRGIHGTPSIFSGGSSSGSAAALAAGLVLGALGSDTGGSIRTPASLCGLAGIKPTFGLVSRHGVLPNCFSLDHCGPLARTAEDCAILLEAIAGYDPRDLSSTTGPKQDFRAALRTDLKDLRVGVVRHFGKDPSVDNEELGRGTDEAVKVLQRLRARVHDVDLRSLRDYMDVWILIEEPETFAIQRQVLNRTSAGFRLDVSRAHFDRLPVPGRRLCERSAGAHAHGR